VPHAIARLNRYGVIIIGAAVATTAAGFDIGKATILMGALGVGVGFGLQNVVNNFVSGLILLFERPIRVGDIVEVGSASGEVQEIGMRATRVKNWQGAELIVPNASLISAEVVNWTLKRDLRRLELPVGVAYGSDPVVVERLLVAAAAAHSQVFEHPEPYCLFMAFGDSSLDFELRAWVPATKGVRVASELRFEIVRALDEAGITIPFPQREVRLRTTDPDAASAVEGTTGEPADPAERTNDG
jgi:small-conductance mechanosensitive channel